MLLEPHANVKMSMVRKPVHMIKPRVVTLQKSSHDSLEKSVAHWKQVPATQTKRETALTLTQHHISVN